MGKAQSIRDGHYLQTKGWFDITEVYLIHSNEAPGMSPGWVRPR